MEENTSIFSNKIVGILVAVVVLATVLVPICNAFSNGNGSGNGSDGGVYNNPGQELDLVDLSDTSKIYTFSKDDIPVGDIVFWGESMWIDEDDGEEYYDYWAIIHDIWTDYNGDTYDCFRWVGTDFHIEEPTVKIWYNVDYGDDGRWTFRGGSGEWSDIASNLDEGVKWYIPKGYVSNPTESIWGYATETYTNNVKLQGEYDIFASGIHTVGSTGEYDMGFGILISSQSDELLLTYAGIGERGHGGTFFPEDEFTVINPVEITIEDSTLKYSTNILRIEYDGQIYECPLSFYGIIPKTVTLDSGIDAQSEDDSNGGISSTLIGIIPVFVAVALLGAIVALFMRKDSLTE